MTMRKRLQRLLAVIAWSVAIGAHPAAAADSMRCGQRLIGDDDYAAELLSVCGEPDYRDVWSAPAPYGGGWVIDAEEWYYDFGPNQLVRVVRLRNGRIDSIQTDGYGFARQRQSRRCGPHDIIGGLSKFRLVRLCGEPMTRRFVGVFQPFYGSPYGPRHGFPPGVRSSGYAPVYREEWTYNFGARHLLQVVTLENGRVVEVDSGDRGFD